MIGLIPRYPIIITAMLAKLLVIVITLSTPFTLAAPFAPSHRLLVSPYSAKTFLLHNSHSSTKYASARHICSQYPHGKLAEISAGSGDVEFLGGFVESLDEPYWIGGLTDSPTAAPCAAIYSGGAVAIPKPPSQDQSPCTRKLNVLCEIET